MDTTCKVLWRACAFADMSGWRLPTALQSGGGPIPSSELREVAMAAPKALRDSFGTKHRTARSTPPLAVEFRGASLISLLQRAGGVLAFKLSRAPVPTNWSALVNP